MSQADYDEGHWSGFCEGVKVGASVGLIVGVALGLFVLPNIGRAETTIGVHAASWHSAPGYNNANPGLYVVHNGWTAGGYRNSIRKESFYAGYTYEMAVPSTGIRLGATFGAITGYRKSPAFLLAPSARIALRDGWGARLFYIPRVDFTRSHIIHLTFERSF